MNVPDCVFTSKTTLKSLASRDIWATDKRLNEVYYHWRFNFKHSHGTAITKINHGDCTMCVVTNNFTLIDDGWSDQGLLAPCDSWLHSLFSSSESRSIELKISVNFPKKILLFISCSSTTDRGLGRADTTSGTGSISPLRLILLFTQDSMSSLNFMKTT